MRKHSRKKIHYRRTKRMHKKRKYHASVVKVYKPRLHSRKLYGGMAGWLAEQAMGKGFDYIKSTGNDYVKGKIGSFTETSLGKQVTGFTSSLVNRADQATAEAKINISAMRAIANDPEKWKNFGNGSEQGREDYLRLLESPISKEMMAQRCKIYYNDPTRVWMDAMDQVASQSKIQTLHGIASKNFDDFKTKLDVAEGMSYKTFEQHIKEQYTDDRNLENCIYFGGVDKDTPKHDVASFCMPEVVEHGHPNKIDMLCFSLKEIQLYVKEQKAAGVQKIPTYMFAEIKQRLPRADIQPVMSHLWVEAIEIYPTFEKMDIVVMTIIRMLHRYATDHVPYMKEVLSYTEAIKEKVSSITPQWLKKILKKGKVNIIYFMKSPRVMQTAILFSQFLRLVCCVWISTWGRENPAMSFINIANVMIELAEPLANSNPLYALPYIWLKVAMKGGKVVGKLLSFDLMGAMFAACELILQSGDAINKTLGFSFSGVIAVPLKIILGWNVTQLNEVVGNYESYLSDLTNKAVQYVTGKGNVMGANNIGFELMNAMNGDAWTLQLKEHFSEWLTMFMVSIIPHGFLNKLLTLVITAFGGPVVLASYLKLADLVDLFYPGQNIIIVLYTASQKRGNMLMHTSPFKEMMIMYSFLHEIFLWISEVGKCGMMKIYYDYVAKYVEKDFNATKHKIASQSFETCCMQDQVNKIKKKVQDEVNKREAIRIEEETKMLKEKEVKEEEERTLAKGKANKAAILMLDEHEKELDKLEDRKEAIMREMKKAKGNEKKLTKLERELQEIEMKMPGVQEEINKLGVDLEGLVDETLATLMDKATYGMDACLTSLDCPKLEDYVFTADMSKDKVREKIDKLLRNLSLDYNHVKKSPKFKDFERDLFELFSSKVNRDAYQKAMENVMDEIVEIIKNIKEVVDGKISVLEDERDETIRRLIREGNKNIDHFKVLGNQMKKYFKHSFVYHRHQSIEDLKDKLTKFENRLIDPNRKILTSEERQEKKENQRFYQGWFKKKDNTGKEQYSYCEVYPKDKVCLLKKGAKYGAVGVGAAAAGTLAAPLVAAAGTAALGTAALGSAALAGTTATATALGTAAAANALPIAAVGAYAAYDTYGRNED